MSRNVRCASKQIHFFFLTHIFRHMVCTSLAQVLLSFLVVHTSLFCYLFQNNKVAQVTNCSEGMLEPGILPDASWPWLFCGWVFSNLFFSHFIHSSLLASSTGMVEHFLTLHWNQHFRKAKNVSDKTPQCPTHLGGGARRAFTPLWCGFCVVPC